MIQMRRLPLPEFIALTAMTFGMVAFSIDGMLPALPEIAAEISAENRNRAQLVLTSFILGMGIGTLFTGPLSDTFGRKKVIFCGAVLYVIGAALAGQATDMTQMIGARMLQGLGVAAPRIVALAIVRDLYEGRRMAQIMSYAMMIFTILPAIAPFVGAFIIDAFGWRMIFGSFVLFCTGVTGWMMLRQQETLPSEKRRPFLVAALWAATKECFSYRAFLVSTVSQVATFGILFGALSSTQQIFDQTYGVDENFPEWFALIAILGGMASILNARLVVVLGMRRMIEIGFGGQALLSASVLVLGLSLGIPFTVYIIWTTSVFFMAGLVIGNLNALAMEPIGHIAGLGASVLGAVATVLGVFIAAPLGLMFDGTPLPLAMGVMGLSCAGFGIVRWGMT